MPAAPRRFFLVRREDPTGLTGTGIVASGVQFPDGTAVLRWNSTRPSTCVFDDIGDLLSVHGHGDAHTSTVDFIDP